MGPGALSRGLDEDYAGQKRFQTTHPPELLNEVYLWLMGAPAANHALRDTWMQLLQRYPGGIPLRDLIGTVHDRLLALGLCPGGSSFQAKNYRETGGTSAERKPWYTCYDWTTGAPVPLVYGTPHQKQHVAAM